MDLPINANGQRFEWMQNLCLGAVSRPRLVQQLCQTKQLKNDGNGLDVADRLQVLNENKTT